MTAITYPRPGSPSGDAAAGVYAVRADGGLVQIRPAEAADRVALQELNARSSDRSLYMRFFSGNRRAADSYVDVELRPAGPDHQARVAVIGEELVGIGSYEKLGPDEAEVALLVDDAHQKMGIGTLLLEHLAALGRAAGLRRFVAETLAENYRMLGVFAQFGFAVRRLTEHGTVHVTCSLMTDETAIAAVDERERRAGVASLAPLFAPRSVVVVGASQRPRTVGREILHSILQGGYTGEVFAVNRRGGMIEGLPAYASVEALPRDVDQAIIAVPAADVLDVVRACARRGVRTVVLVTAGFGELGAEGRDLQDTVLAAARRTGMRLVGPNCLGLVKTDPAVRLDATFAPLPWVPGTLGLASQSGALGIAVLKAAAPYGVGVSQFVSVGNKADVSGNDLLLYWEQDPRTTVIALYLESFGNPRKFARIARRVSRHKPILALKAGRTVAGQRAGLSHTAAAASSDAVVDAMFDQAGVLRMDTVEQILEVTQVFAALPLPSGPRVAVIGNSGGPEILAADAAVAGALDVSVLGAATRAALEAAAPAAAAWSNPVDLGAAAQPSVVKDTIRVLLGSADVDAVMAVFAETTVADITEILTAIAEAAAGATKPVVVTLLGADVRSISLPGGTASLPVFPFPEPAARALATARRYAVLRDRPVGDVVSPDGIDRDGATRRVEELLESGLGKGDRWLTTAESADVLGRYGIRVCPQRTVSSARDATAAAAEIGFPVALKIARGDVVHKTEAGGVALGLADAQSVTAAYARVVDTCGDGDPWVVVQQMVPTGTELIVGAVQDPQFGPVVMLGAGGVLSDLLADRTFRILPLTDVDSAEMIEGLRMAPLLDGYRGRPIVSRVAVRDLLHRVAGLVEDFPQIAELDLNPVVCLGADLVVADAKIRLAAAARPDTLVRRLR